MLFSQTWILLISVAAIAKKRSSDLKDLSNLGDHIRDTERLYVKTEAYMYMYLSDRYVDLWHIFCAKFSLKKVVAGHTQSLSFHPYFLSIYLIFFSGLKNDKNKTLGESTYVLAGWPRPCYQGKKNQPYRDGQRRYLLAHPDFCWDNLIWAAVIVREIEGLLIRVKKKKHVKNRQTPWENLFASDQQNIRNRDSYRGKTNVNIMSVSSVKIIRISYEYHW